MSSASPFLRAYERSFQMKTRRRARHFAITGPLDELLEKVNQAVSAGSDDGGQHNGAAMPPHRFHGTLYLLRGRFWAVVIDAGETVALEVHETGPEKYGWPLGDSHSPPTAHAPGSELELVNLARPVMSRAKRSGGHQAVSHCFSFVMQTRLAGSAPAENP